MESFQKRTTARRDEVLGTLEELQAFLSERALEPRTRNAVEVAAEELLSNVSKYGFPEGLPGEVSFAVELGPGGVRLEIRDSGRPFDPTAAPPPPELTLYAEPGGRGLLLVRGLSGSMTYRRDGPLNVLVVEFPSP